MNALPETSSGTSLSNWLDNDFFSYFFTFKPIKVTNIKLFKHYITLLNSKLLY